MASKSTFSIQLAAFAKKASDLTDTIVKEVVINIAARIDSRSPVGNSELWAANVKRAARGLPPLPAGYIGGRFRGNWQLGVGSAPSGELARIDPGGGATQDEILGRIPARAAGHRYFLVNNLPYAQVLEDGHSKQAPAGMVMLASLEAPQIVRDVIAAEKGAAHGYD